MVTVDIDDPETTLEALVEMAEQGEEVVIARSGEPLARVTAVAAAAPCQPRRLGSSPGKFKVPPDFDTMMQDEIILMFEGQE